MNAKIFLICLGAMLLAHESDAFFLWNRFARFGAFGPFGFGFRPFGFGPFGPFGPFGGFPGAFPLIGKRSLNVNATECMITSESQKFVCSGVHQFSCDIAQNFTGLGAFSFVIKDLALNKVVELEEPMYCFLAQKEVDSKIINEKFTLINPVDNKEVVLSVYGSEKLHEKLGFRFVDHKCWEQFETMVKESKPEDLDFELIISQTA